MNILSNLLSTRDVIIYHYTHHNTRVIICQHLFLKK
nr:MAG TPA: hypothetical protein [Caudoviricetes sp.]